MYLYVAILLFIPDQLYMNPKVSNIMFHSNNFVRRLLDFAVRFLFSCLYCSMTGFANEKPRTVNHLWTIISNKFRLLPHLHFQCMPIETVLHYWLVLRSQGRIHAAHVACVQLTSHAIFSGTEQLMCIFH